MFSRDEVNKTITIQDNSATDLYDLNDLVKRINQTNFLMKDDNEESPARFYSNAQFSFYNDYLKSQINMAQQFTYLVRRLKTAHLPVTLPDAEYFARSFKRIKDSGLTGDEFDDAIQLDAEAFKKALDTAVKSNIETAKKHNISLEKPEKRKDIN